MPLSHNHLLRLGLLASTALVPCFALANPVGGQVTGGSANIAQSGGTTTINQSSGRAIIDWQGFDVGASEQVRFNQPSSSSITLNRIHDVKPSQIDGQLTANGQIYLVNSHGIVFGGGSQVNVGGLIATSSDIANGAFMAGNDQFTIPGDANAEISNAGRIALSGSGLAALVGPHVRNSGQITATVGTVALASGDTFTLDPYGDGLVNLQASPAIQSQLIEHTGSIAGAKIVVSAAAVSDTVSSLVNLDGLVQARDITVSGKTVSLGGTISADAATGGSIKVSASDRLSLAENISARGMSGKGGSITLTSGSSIETSSSQIDASGATDGGSIRHVSDGHILSSGHYLANGGTGQGGSIDFTGLSIAGLSTTFDANGATNGGSIRIGGEYQGGKNLATDELPNALATLLNDTTRISARGEHGKGGTVIVWSDENTAVYGGVDVRSGNGGQGGFVEISSGDTLTYRADVQAGTGGTLLLDPKNITIADNTSGFDSDYAIFGKGYTAGKNVNSSTLETNDDFGYSISLSGNRLAVGANGDDGFGNSTYGSGAVYLFSFTNANFSGGALEATIGKGYSGGKNIDVSALEINDGFGSSVSLDGNRLAVGAAGDSGFNNSTYISGAVYLFSFTDAAFSGGTLQATLGKGYTGGKNIDVSTLATGDNFGFGVSLDGNRLAIAAPGDDGFGNSTNGSGAVYLFSFTDAAFSGGALEATIGKGYTGGKNIDVGTLEVVDGFGFGVSLDGNRLAVGAVYDDGLSNVAANSGAAYLFTFTDAAFNGGTLQATIGKGYTGGKNVNVSTLEAGDGFGRSVSLDGNRLAVGAYKDPSSANGVYYTGAVYLFSFTDSAFTGGTREATLGKGYTGGKNVNVSALASYDFFGTSVSLDGNRLAVGAYGDKGVDNNSDYTGAVHLFSFTDAAFNGGTLEATIGKGYLSGSKNVNVGTLEANDYFGSAVSLDGNRLAVGTQNDDGFGNSASNSGAVYLFSFTDANFSGGVLEGMIGNGYTGGKNIDVSTLEANDNFGSSLSLDGNRLAVGAAWDDGFGNSASNSGAVYLFSFTDSAFTGGTLLATLGKGYTGGKNVDVSALDAGDYFGIAVSLDGNRLAVGATGDSGFSNNTTYAGAVRLFTFTDSAFSGGALEATIGKDYTGGKNVNVGTLEASDYFGSAVSLDGNRLAVGVAWDDGFGNSATNSGTVYLLSFTDAVFSGGALEATIGKGYTGGKNVNVGTLEANDSFGSGISLDGYRLVIGAQNDDGFGNSTTNSGAVYLFSFTDAVFSGGALEATIGKGYTGGKNIDISGLDNSDLFGGSVSFDGSRLAVGTWQDSGSGNSAAKSGAVYLFPSLNSSSLTGMDQFADIPGSSITITPDDITAILNSGTAVTLQANNDITVTDAITANNPGGNGGALTLQAGRSILINANITTDNGNFTAYANSLSADGVVNAQRDAGDATITMGSGTSIDAGTGAIDLQLKSGTGNTNTAAGDITLGGLTGSTLFVKNFSASDDVVLRNGAALSGSGAGTNITLVSGHNFVNNSGSATPLSDGAGRFLIYSTNPADDTLNGMTAGFRRFSCAYGGACPTLGSGNGFLYSYTPLLTVTPNAANVTYGDAASFSSAISGYLGSDSGNDGVTGAAGYTTLYAPGSDVGHYDITGTAGTLASSLGYGFTGATHSNGLTVTQRSLTATADAKNRAYGAANPAFTISYSGFATGDDASMLDTLPVATSSANAASPIGSYVISASGGADMNYSFSYIDGLLSVTSTGPSAAQRSQIEATTTLQTEYYRLDPLQGGGDKEVLIRYIPSYVKMLAVMAEQP